MQPTTQHPTEGISQKGEINKLVRAVKELTDVLPIPLGHIWRISVHSLKNYGISVTDENKEWLEERSLESYKHEWEEANPLIYEAIHNAVSESGLGHGNDSLNTQLALFAVEVLTRVAETKKRGEEIVVYDIGAGTGATTGLVLNEIKMRDRSLLKKLWVVLVEPARESIRRLEALMKKDKERDIPGEFTDVRSTIIDDTDEYLAQVRRNSVDLLVSNAVFHHKSFPTHLYEISQILKSTGVCIIGDWYTEVWSKPKWLAYIMKEALKADKINLPGSRKTVLEAFMENFCISSSDEIQESWENAPEDVKKRNNGMLFYIKNLAKNIAEAREQMPEKRLKGLYLLEAHRSHEDFLKEAEEAGLINPKKIKGSNRNDLCNTSKTDVVPYINGFACVDVLCKKNIEREKAVKFIGSRGKQHEKHKEKKKIRVVY
ncbi:MAG: methyltransferase domain-containing protein [Candidatus Bilamarchaeaceae archaeon]